MRKGLCILAAAILLPSWSPTRAGELTNVAGRCKGSSNATFYPSNHRVAVTKRGRWLVLYDVHGVGQQLVWRNSANSRWRTRTRGDTSHGFIPDGRLGDRPASIALAPDKRGRQHAWIVWSGYEFAQNPLPVKMRRLSGLDAPGGPRVGRSVKIAKMGKGNARVDVAFERAGGGRFRGVISWVRRIRRHRYQLVVRWFTQLGTNTPPTHHGRVLVAGRRPSLTGTLVPSRRGMRLVARTASGKLKVFTHPRRAPLWKWRRSEAGIPVSAGARPSGVMLGRGRVGAAAESSSRRDVVTVVRFSPTGKKARVMLRLRGHGEPTLAARGDRAWLVMTRRRDGAVVSRSFRLGSGWTQRDRLEIGSRNGTGHRWPNVLRAPRGRLGLILGGPGCPTSNARSVLAYQRKI
jgi:hypothetical protein